MQQDQHKQNNFINMSKDKITLQNWLEKSTPIDATISTMRSTGNSYAFRSIGRNKNPQWTNRFVKDNYDLTYQPNYSQTKERTTIDYSFRKGWKNQNKHKRQKDRMSRLSRNTEKIQRKSESRSIKEEQRKDYLTPNKSNPERIYMKKDSYSNDQTLGLCRSQYVKTIQGKIKFKASHHLSFNKNLTQRELNEHKVWYNPQLTINKQQIQEMKKIIEKNKMHSFKSYIKRRVFEPKKQLDKIYDAPKPGHISQLKIVSLNKITGRKPDPKRISSTLSYNTIEALQRTRVQPKFFQFAQTPRSMEFSRQVISPQRGCYR